MNAAFLNAKFANMCLSLAFSAPISRSEATQTLTPEYLISHMSCVVALMQCLRHRSAARMSA